jgi:hypothetical protein
MLAIEIMTSEIISEDNYVFFDIDVSNYQQVFDWLSHNIGCAGKDYDWIQIRLKTRGIRVYDPKKLTLVRLRWG